MLTQIETLTPSTARSRPVVDLDPDAFTEVIEEHKDQIVNYLTRLTGQRERAEDIAQETFVRFYQHRHRYREEGHLTAYLLRIATNLVRTEERRKKRWRLLQPKLTREDDVPATDDAVSVRPAPGPQRRLLAMEAHRQVTRAIADLDFTYRVPLVLREIEGLSYREIADVLKLNEGTVKSRLFRARDLLKQKLEPYWKGGQS